MHERKLMASDRNLPWGFVMTRKVIVPAAAVLIALLTACAVPLLSSGERKEVCQVVVEGRFGSPKFQPNVLSNPAGGLTGAGVGALGGLSFAPNILMIFTVPIGAAIGAAGGSACAVASAAHPTADADFTDILLAADASALARAVEAGFNAPRVECSPSRAVRTSAAGPDGVVEIEKLRVGMGCLLGRMEYWIAVDWRTVNLRSRKELNSTTTRCAFTANLDVDDWFADRARAQKEIEAVLEATGRRMVLQLLSDDVLRGECRLQSNAAGAVGPY